MNHSSRSHILIVEDNLDTQLLLRHLLQRDYDLTVRQTVREAIDSACTKRYALILLDINLGEELTGIDVLEEIRKRPENADAPAIAMTAYAMPGDRERFLEVGFAAYIAKPFTRVQLLSCVDRVLSSRTPLKNC